MATIGTRTQIISAALGALVVGGVVALASLSHDDPGDSPSAGELLGGPPGAALPTDPSVISSPAASSSQGTAPSQPGQSGQPGPPAGPSGAPKPGPPTRPGGFPQAANTGPVPGAALTVVTGDQTFAQSGQVIEGKDFHGFVKVAGKNITFRNCVFRGRVANGNAALLDTERASGTVVEDSEFGPSNPAATIDDIAAANTTIVRANIHGGVDGVKANSNTVIQDSWIHDMTWFASDPNQGGGPTHNDGVQSFAGESNILLRHNTIDLTGTKDGNAAWQTSATDSRAENNVFDGGGCMLNFDHKSAGHPIGGNAVVNNRFGRRSAFDCPILLSSQASLSINAGNVWNDTGMLIPPPQQHD